MIQRKKRFSWILILSLGVLFALGLSQVYLFLQGGSFKPELQKGYMEVASNTPVFINNRYEFEGYKKDQYLIGEYNVCFSELGKDSRCLDRTVTSNEEEIISIESETLSYRDGYKKDWLTDETVYFLPDKTGFMWHDSSKNQFFYGGESDEYIYSFFPQAEVIDVIYNNKDQKYCYTYAKEKEGTASLELVANTENNEVETECLDLWSFSFPQLANEKRFKIEENTNSILRLYPAESFLNNPTEITKASFSSTLAQVFPLNDQSHILVFDTSIFMFSENTLDFRLISLKDSDTDVVFYPSKQQLYFIYEKAFLRLYL